MQQSLDSFLCTNNSMGNERKAVIAVIGRSVLIAISDKRVVMGAKDIEVLKFFHERKIHLGTWNESDCEVWELTSDAVLPSEYSLIDLRSLLVTIPEPLFSVVCRAVQLLEWQTNHKFCGRCGQATRESESDLALSCASCGFDNYPRISPCVIVVVTRGDSCILARQENWNEGLYSALAGFVEAGESAEDALHREVFEEVGVSISKLRYIGSQSWPFPGQLMLGFLAEATSENLKVDGTEISDARWWQYDKMPPIIPPATVMSGMLIERFINEARGLYSSD